MRQPELGLKITELRKQKGLTQEELVDLCNINVRTLQRIENGEVSPRSYTIKTILSALDYDYDVLGEDKGANEVSDGINLRPKEAKSTYSLLTMSWIVGIIAIICSIFAGIAGWKRHSDDYFLFGKMGYIYIQTLSFVLGSISTFGFLILGRLLKNYLMKITTVLGLVIGFVLYSYDVLSIFHELINDKVVGVISLILTGPIAIFFGISFLKSSKSSELLFQITGIANIVLGVCYLTVILSPIGIFLAYPVWILEIILLYKISILVKNRMEGQVQSAF